MIHVEGILVGMVGLGLAVGSAAEAQAQPAACISLASTRVPYSDFMTPDSSGRVAFVFGSSRTYAWVLGDDPCYEVSRSKFRIGNFMNFVVNNYVGSGDRGETYVAVQATRLMLKQQESEKTLILLRNNSDSYNIWVEETEPPTALDDPNTFQRFDYFHAVAPHETKTAEDSSLADFEGEFDTKWHSQIRGRRLSTWDQRNWWIGAGSTYAANFFVKDYLIGFVPTAPKDDASGVPFDVGSEGVIEFWLETMSPASESFEHSYRIVIVP